MCKFQVSIKFIIDVSLLCFYIVIGTFTNVQTAIKRMFDNQVCFDFSKERTQPSSSEKNLYLQVIKEFLQLLEPLSTSPEHQLALYRNETEFMNESSCIHNKDLSDNEILSSDSESKI